MKVILRHSAERVFTRFICLLVFAVCFAAAASAQGADNQNPFGADRNGERDQPRTVKDYLAKQRAEKAKKEYEELLERGDELAELAGQLESAYERSKNLTSADRAKLDSVEKLAEKIRKSLGGDDDDDVDGDRQLAERNPEAPPAPDLGEP